jgi:type I restriction enzyme S subunit
VAESIAAVEGLAPGWARVAVADACPLIMDFRGRTPRKLGMAWGGGTIPALSAGNVKMGYVDLEEETHLGSDALYRRWMTDGPTRAGDILFTTEAPLGNVALVPDDRRYILSQRTILLRPDPIKVDSNYLYQALQAADFRRQLQENTTGSTATGIQRRRLERLEVLVPRSLIEQRAIAEALDDADALVRALGLMIDKKQSMRVGAAQTLLSGRVRLPGFIGEWQSMVLREVLTVRHGKSQRQVTVAGGRYPVLATSGEIGRTDSYLWDQPSVLIGRKGTIDAPQYMDTPFWSIDTLFYTDIKPAHHAKFIYYFFEAIPWKAFNEASGVPSLNAATIEAIEVSLPKRDEQMAIAEVLSDMDREIEMLEVRRSKMRDLKISMAQKLLSQATRLA